MTTTLNVNGQDTKELDDNVDPKMPLLWALRDFLGLTGTKYGCGRAFCGACTVHIDGEATRSCAIMVKDAVGKRIMTIEGAVKSINGELKQKWNLNAEAQAVIAAWRELNVVQCGYCQPGQIMSAIILLAKTSKLTDRDIDLGMEGNICRCGTYKRIRAAIHEAARRLGKEP